MKIVQGLPPNINEIAKVLPVYDRPPWWKFWKKPAAKPGLVFAYGDTVYVNGYSDLSPELKAHEAVHLEQQRFFGGPKKWWKRYLKDPKFRYREELVAHRAEYRVLRSRDRHLARRVLPLIAARLASPLYGNMVSVKKARKAIRGY